MGVGESDDNLSSVGELTTSSRLSAGCVIRANSSKDTHCQHGVRPHAVARIIHGNAFM
jgi:hypothetical protein